MTTNTEIAEWLINEIRTNGPRRSYQERLVRTIREKFGDEWSYRNHNSNPAIDKGVLKEFGKLKDEFVIWDRSDQSWRVVSPEELEHINARTADRKLRNEETRRLRAEHEANASALR